MHEQQTWVAAVATCNRLHDQARRLAGPVGWRSAHQPVLRFDPLKVERAAKLEEQAALLADGLPDFEPSRSRLFRSAAWLWLLTGERDKALQLARRGLTDQTPDEVAAGLRELIGLCGEEA